MSQIATLQIVPDSSVEAIRAAAVPQKAGWFGKTHDVFWESLQKLAPDVLNPEWSGDAMVVLLEFLRERRGFDFDAVDSHPLAEFLSKSRGSYFGVFAPEVAQSLSKRLASENLAESELAAFANEFSETDDADAGKPLLGASRSLGSGTGSGEGGHARIVSRRLNGADADAHPEPLLVRSRCAPPDLRKLAAPRARSAMDQACHACLCNWANTPMCLPVVGRVSYVSSGPGGAEEL